MDIKGMKIRHDAWGILADIAEVGFDVKRIPPGQDGWHSAASVAAFLADQFQKQDGHRGRKPAPRETPAAMSVEAAYNSGRITATSRPDWEQRYAANPDATAAALASLAPVWDNTSNSSVPGPLTAEEELDMIDDALFGAGHSEMSRKRMRTQQDEQALREHREIVAAENQPADDLTNDEFRATFGHDRED